MYSMPDNCLIVKITGYYIAIDLNIAKLPPATDEWSWRPRETIRAISDGTVRYAYHEVTSREPYAYLPCMR